jgi:hypothetical protein
VPASSRRQLAVASSAALIALVAVAGYLGYRALFPAAPPLPPVPGCQAWTGAQSVSLDTDQAGIAAIITAVADRRKLPEQAVVIGLATAMQESDLENLDYGDRDSVGVFQQRPSQGWGTTAELENPVYAAGKFFGALAKVPRYTKIPVYQAAQDVQHSADGDAYATQEYVAGLLAADFTGAAPHSVTCWYTPAADVHADVTGAAGGLRDSFGSGGHDSVTVKLRNETVLRVRGGEGWTAATWLVTHAQQYQLTDVRYAGYEWKAADGSMGWHRDSGPPRASVVAG